MTPKLYLNFYDDAERIKDHMIYFLADNGTVSKTRFGIELGTICKTPNRGRTKLVLEAYPDIFSSDGETVSLLITPPQRPTISEQDKESEDKKQQRSNTSPASSQKLSKSKQSTDLAMEIQPAQTDSRHLSQPLTTKDYTGFSTSVTSRQKSFPFTMTSPQYSEYVQKDNISVPAGSSKSFGLKTYAPYASSSKFQSGSKEYGTSPYMDSPEFRPTVFQYNSPQQPTSNILKSDENMESQKSPFYQEYSEATVINLLKHSGGSMEVSDLVLSLGISLSDSQARHNLYDLLSASPSIGINGEQIFLVEAVVQQEQQQQSLALEPTMQALPEQEQDREQPQAVSGQSQSSRQSQTNTGNFDIQQQSSLYEEEQEEQEEQEVEGVTSEFEFDMSEYSSLPQQMPQSVSVSNINVNNIHIQTVNLHLHIQQPNDLQVQELLKFQSLMQDMLNLTKHSA